MDHRQRSQRRRHWSSHTRLHQLWMTLRIDRDRPRTVAVNDVLMVTECCSIRSNVRGLSFSCSLCATRSLFTSQVFLRKTLLSCLCLPVVIPHPSTVLNDSATELSKHRFGSDDRNLSRSVRVRQDFLMNQIVLFRLSCDDFVQRPILVEKQIRVSVTQDTCAFRGKHEQFIPSIRYQECSTFVLAPF